MSRKRCSKCKRVRFFSAYAKRKGGKNGLAAHCKDCQKIYWNQFYKDDNRVKHIERSKSSAKVRRRALRELVQKLKSVPCRDCGNSYPYYVMQFDHLPDYVKSDNLSSLINKGVGESILRAEIAKCDIVCANCHCERTFQRGSHKDGLDTCNV